MQRFTFTMASVLRVREQEEQAVQVELARVVRERAGVLEQMRMSRTAEEELYEYLRQPGRTAAEMRHVAQFGTLHRQRIFELGIKIRQYDKGVELVRTRLIAAQAKRKSLEKLREQQRSAWETEFRRLEQEELDEIATMRAARGLGAVA
jgi:flagellar FliJ protein